MKGSLTTSLERMDSKNPLHLQLLRMFSISHHLSSSLEHEASEKNPCSIEPVIFLLESANRIRLFLQQGLRLNWLSGPQAVASNHQVGPQNLDICNCGGQRGSKQRCDDSSVFSYFLCLLRNCTLRNSLLTLSKVFRDTRTWTSSHGTRGLLLMVALCSLNTHCHERSQHKAMPMDQGWLIEAGSVRLAQ